MFAHGSTARLTAHDLGRFAGETLFDRLGRAVCQAGCLPRKELYEAWEMGRRVRRVLRGGRVVDLGGGHGLLAHVLLLLDDTSPAAVVVDLSPPRSHVALSAALAAQWPRLAGRVTYVAGRCQEMAAGASDLVVSCHACGPLTDDVLSVAIAGRAPVAVLPCCHDRARSDDAALSGWMPADLAIDAARAMRLRQHGYRVWTREIPAAVTPRNRLLIGAPAAA
jgi:hypothetical protein